MAIYHPPPLQVNAFIRFCRWSALGLGIAWGAWRCRVIRGRHEKLRIAEHREEVALHEQNVKMEAIANKESLLGLAIAAGMTVDDNLKKQLGIAEEIPGASALAAHH